MDIKTAYNVGDHVWIMINNKPTMMIVESVAAYANGKPDIAIQYVGRQCSTQSYRTVYKDIPEHKVFKSKYALLRSLFAPKEST